MKTTGNSLPHNRLKSAGRDCRLSHVFFLKRRCSPATSATVQLESGHARSFRFEGLLASQCLVNDHAHRNSNIIGLCLSVFRASFQVQFGLGPCVSCVTFGLLVADCLSNTNIYQASTGSHFVSFSDLSFCSIIRM